MPGRLGTGPTGTLSLVHCQKSISKGRTTINFSSGNSHLEVQPRLQGHGYPPLPYQGLRCYLDRTRDLRGNRQLLFISFKQGHTKDIQCSTISSWIKNTIKFCYSKVDNADMDLLGVKAHNVRAFAASKAFYRGVSMDQIMQACHWKSHNTQGPSRTRSDRRLLPPGRLHRSTAGDASFHISSRDKKGGHKTGNHVDGACQNPDTIGRTFHPTSGN